MKMNFIKIIFQIKARIQNFKKNKNMLKQHRFHKFN